MRWIDRLEFKYGRFGIANLMAFITAGRAIAYFLGLRNPDFVGFLLLDPDAVWRGEFWRLFSFVLTPPSGGVFFAFMDLYFTFIIGRILEEYWGAFRFTLYYLIGGLATAITAFLFLHVPVAPYYLNYSLFLAFATLFPDFTVLLFFVLPVKIKYLGWIAVMFLTLAFWMTGLSGKVAIVVAFANYIAFFWRDIKEFTKSRFRTSSYHPSAPTPLPPSVLVTPEMPPPPPTHKCSVCGKTERDNPGLDFRWCACKKCGDGMEFCMEHLKEHRAPK